MEGAQLSEDHYLGPISQYSGQIPEPAILESWEENSFWPNKKLPCKPEDQHIEAKPEHYPVCSSKLKVHGS